MMRVDGKVAVVTGSGSGIGEAIAKRLSKEGAIVAICDLDEANGNRVADEILSTGNQAAFFKLDVSKEQNMKETIDKVVEKFGKFDIMVNNAGIGKAGTVIEQTEADWDLMMNVNAKGAFFGCKYAVKKMLDLGTKGSIVNIASVAGMVGVFNRAGYCASKAAIAGLTKSVASDFAEQGIRVNSISPGTIESPWIKKILSDNPEPEQARIQMQQRQPIGRMGTPDEIANLAVFLASDEASFITGSNMVADGGLTAR
ncbi:NAD(P)-dependent dehydrogenase (short-subunit alcohol dehydrogenase family) [Ammoniphilus resinae]|uniref:NAD(P)-dependent dehydrogenase (Short-subunit alcohol dehydrogenase family) n=2 Tax=Ammoniphilus resinae TaxID=861532 RepID=A0ABS4GQX6_9BACL|nr:NAD(P)-dependent dehydrogenase (short-subunit alcohol dehydrogenase family) [Ammoniphilus resinae]